MTTGIAGQCAHPLVVPGPWATIGDRIAYLAALTPDALAIASTDQAYSYRGLLNTATSWSSALRAHLAGQPGRPVALPIETDARGAVALVAIALSGHPAVPIDPMLPTARQARIVDSSGAMLLRVDELAALPAAADPVLAPAGIEDPAVIFYTSGSTGEPKGLVHSHGAWLNQAYSAQLAMDLEQGDRNALIMPLAFGGGLDILFMSILTGGSVHVYDPRINGIAGLAPWLEAQAITTVHGTPSLIRSLLNAMPADAVLSGVRLVSTAGESIHSSAVERLRRHMEPGSVYLGWSGASEIGMLAHLRIGWGETVPQGIVPVGFPCANKEIRVLDAAGHPVGPGVTGEVAITSRYLSHGYFGNAELTAQKMTRLADGRTTYRGGDLGQFDEQGRLHLRGRSDAAVKVGGYLVEPAEVEAALLGLPNIVEAVVSAAYAAAEGGGRRARIVAHVVPATTERSVTPAAVRRALRDVLPSWMVPSVIVMMTALPRNERGKVDRQALPAAEAVDRFAKPATETERVLADLWCTVLRLPEVSRTADFWELGADSLSVEELLSAVRSLLGASLTMADLSAAPTVAELATAIDGAAPVRIKLPSTAVHLRRGAPDVAVFAFAGGGASALTLLPIARELSADASVYAFQASGYETRGRPDLRLRDTVRRHLRTIRRLRPDGDFVLVGHSYGGLLALETAAALEREGVATPLVVLLDTRLPDSVIREATGAPAPITPELVGVAAPRRSARLVMHARLLGAGIVRYPPEIRDSVFWEQGLRQINRHTLTPWSGRTLMFAVPDNPDEPQWWARVLTGQLEIQQIEGGHTSILRAPFHGPIVDRLSSELADLRAARRSA